MIYKPGSSYHKLFTTQHPTTGVATDADSTPTATANKNGVDDDDVTLTVTNLATGLYKITGTIPSAYKAGDIVSVHIAATVSAVAGKRVIDTFNIDSYRLSDIGGYVSGSNITVTAPVAETEDITVITGDDYHNTEGRALEWSNSDGDWGDNDITDCTVQFRAVSNIDSTDVFPATGNKAGVVVTGTGTQLVRVVLSNEETKLLTPGEDAYTYHLRVIDNERNETIARGNMTVVESLITEEAE